MEHVGLGSMSRIERGEVTQLIRGARRGIPVNIACECCTLKCIKT
jgi:hypothetical protein